MINPGFKQQLKSYYQAQFPNGEEFDNFWIKAFNQQAKVAPAMFLKKMDGSKFSSAAHQNKWILIDFWGTWCSPCRKEHPDVEKFYLDIQKSFANKIALLTVACKDQEFKVSTYMAQYKYTFPVAMADQKIEEAYNINAYPSKILISPQGKFVIIPFSVDWVSYVKEYASL